MKDEQIEPRMCYTYKGSLQGFLRELDELVYKHGKDKKVMAALLEQE